MMVDPSPQVEVLPQQPYGEQFDGADGITTRARGKQRLRIFVTVMAVVCLLGWGYTFLRPATYQSTATVMIATPPGETDESDNPGRSQRVALHSHVLTSQALLEQVHVRLAGENAAPDSISELREMLAVIPVGETNIVNLYAEGSNAGFLPLLINNWIDAYLSLREASQIHASDSEFGHLKRQVDGLEANISTSRQSLDRFRRENDIISMGQNENQVLARLKGMSDALNTASEDAVTAAANLNAIKEAIASNKPVVRTQDRLTLASLEARAVELREELREMQQKFTPAYMELDPDAIALQRKLELVEGKIRDQLSLGARATLSEAEQALSSARQRVRTLKQQVTDYKQVAADFTTRFSEHEARKEELLQLEELYRGAKERIVQIQVRNEREFPQVEVIERATLPDKPIRPHYWRDAGITLIAAIVLGLVAIWLFEFLTRTPSASAPTLRQLFYAIVDPRVLPQQQSASRALDSSHTPALEQELPRELSEAEVRTLLRTAEPLTSALICSLLSGVVLTEAVNLRWVDVSVADKNLRLPGEKQRTVRLANGAVAYFERLVGNISNQDDWVWLGQDGTGMSIDDLEALITCAVYDSGLAQAAPITAASLRHTYLAYLARQGMRLSELPKLCGPIPPATLSRYGRYSPPGVGKTAQQIATLYPALAT